jgi:hypothetical protein
METQVRETLVEMQAALKTVADLGESLTTQEAHILDAEAETLETLLASLHPVMRYIDSPVRASGYCPGGQFSSWTYNFMPEHGIVLAGELERERDNGDQNRGSFTGEDLVLGRSGTLTYRTFFGSWSQWQGESEYWSTTYREEDEYEYARDEEFQGGDSTVVTAKEALTHYALETIVEGLVAAIKEAVAKTESKQKTLAGRLARLEAVKAALK